MDKLDRIVDETDRIKQAAKLAKALAVCIGEISPRHVPRYVSFSDSERARAVQGLCRAKHELMINLRVLDEQRNAALSPISRLDDDMLQTVLLLTIHSIEAPKQRMNLAIAFSHVSRRWRRTAVSSASLWVDIFVAADERTETQDSPWHPIVSRYCPSKNLLIRSFLDRAKTAPLNVTILDNSVKKMDLVPPTTMLRVDTKVLIPHIAGPLRSLTIEKCSAAVVVGLLESIRDSPDSFAKVSFKQIEMELGMNYGRSMAYQPFTLTRIVNLLELKAPNLREFYFSHSASFAFTLPRLRHLDKLVLSLPDLAQSNMLTILSNYPLLRTLECTFQGSSAMRELAQVGDLLATRTIQASPSTYQSRTRLQHLESLVLNMTASNICFLMDHMEAPTLRRLSLSTTSPIRIRHPILGNNTHRSNRLDQATCSMLRASDASLQELELHNLAYEEFLHILHNNPTIVSLNCGERSSHSGSFDSNSSLDQIARALTPENSALTLSPNLETLVYNGDCRGSLKALLAMVTVRVTVNRFDPLASRPLRRIVLSPVMLSRQDEARLEQIGTLLEGGLVVGGWEFRNASITWVGWDVSGEQPVRGGHWASSDWLELMPAG